MAEEDDGARPRVEQFRRRLDESEAEYMERLRHLQRHIDDSCYSPDPLQQFLNRKAYYARGEDS